MTETTTTRKILTSAVDGNGRKWVGVDGLVRRRNEDVKVFIESIAPGREGTEMEGAVYAFGAVADRYERAMARARYYNLRRDGRDIEYARGWARPDSCVHEIRKVRDL